MINGAAGNSLAETNLRTRHENISVTAPDGTVIFIDKDLGRLLPALWDKGFQTLYSCAGGVNTNKNNDLLPPDLNGYIFFETEKDARSFMEMVKPKFQPDIYPYFLDGKGGLPNMVVRFNTRMIPRFETVFCPEMVSLETAGSQFGDTNAY